jgi:hypothetical protein
MRKLGKVAIVPILASGLIAAAATTAQAAPAGFPGWFKSSFTPSRGGARIRNCATTNCAINGYGYYGQEFYVSQSQVNSYVWDGGQDLSTGTRGWTTESHLAFS